jgi:hypothetical protein
VVRLLRIHNMAQLKITKANQIYFLELALQCMDSAGKTIFVVPAKDPEPTKATMDRWKRAVQRYRRAHGLTTCPTVEAIQWAIQTGDVGTLEDRVEFVMRCTNEILRPYQVNGKCSRRVIAAVIAALKSEAEPEPTPQTPRNITIPCTLCKSAGFLTSAEIDAILKWAVQKAESVPGWTVDKYFEQAIKVRGRSLLVIINNRRKGYYAVIGAPDEIENPGFLESN